MSNLIILQHKNWPPARLLEFLHSRGFSTHPIMAPDELLELTLSVKSPMLMVHAGSSVSTQTEVCRCLLRERDLYRFPLLLVGLQNANLESALKDVYELSAFVRDDRDNKDIFEQLSILQQRYQPEYQKDFSGKQSETEVPGRHTTVIERSDYDAFPDFLFAQLAKLKHAPDLGGARMLRVLSLNELSNLGMLPGDSDARELVLDVFRELRQGSRTHVARVAHMNSQILQALQISEDLLEHSKTAALLYPSSFTQSTASLQRIYLPIAGKENAILMERLNSSAALVGGALPDSRARKLIEGMAQLIGRGIYEAPEELQIVVSALVASDLVHRICFQNGNWNPQGVYSLMKKLRDNKLQELHPSVLAAVAKYVNEAVFARNKHLEIKNPLSPPRDLVPLVQLTPGMKLHSPVLDAEGEVILDGGTVLDEDLIWRVWQLLSLRVLSSELDVSEPD